MAGRKIPHRHIERKAYRLRDRDINEACLYFRELRGFTAAQPNLIPNLSIKALPTEAISAGKGTERSETGPDQDQDVPKLKLDFQPNAKRKPGQMLKLHVTYDELISPQGAKFGWVDPPGAKTPEEARMLQQAQRDAMRNRPPVHLVQYQLDENGNQTQVIKDKIRFKALGKRIAEEAGQIGQAAFRAAGGIIDANGRMRCPPGTPNANQFTDETMANCMVVGVGALRSMFQRVRSNIDAMEQYGAEVRRFGRALTPYERQQQSKFEKMRGGAIATREQIQARGQRFNNILKEVLGDVPENISLDNANADVMEGIFGDLTKRFMDEGLTEKEAQDKAYEFLFGPHTVARGVQEAGIYGDVPGFKICRGGDTVGCSANWDDSKSFRENMSVVAKAYDSAIRKEIEEHIDPAFLSQLEPSARQALLDDIRNRHHLAQRESLSTVAVWSRDYPEAAKRLNSIRALTFANEFNASKGDAVETFATVEGATAGTAAFLEDGQILADVKFNHIQQAITHLLPTDKDLDKVIQPSADGSRWIISPDESLSEPARIAEMLRVAEEISDAIVYAESVGYANEASAARLNAALGLDGVRGKARHIAYHELGHVLQYNAFQQNILDVYERDGSFVLPTGRVLASPPETWTNDEWFNAITSTQTYGAMYDFPPGGAVTFEKSLVNLFAGQYYQNELRNATDELAKGDKGDVNGALRLALMEGSAEIYAQYETGILVGENVVDSIRWMLPEEMSYRRPRDIPANMPPGFGEPDAEIPEPDAPDIPTAPPTSPPSPWPPPSEPPIPAPPDGSGTPREIPVGFADLSGHIWLDNETQWHPEHHQSIPLEQNDDEIRGFVDAAFAMGPDEGGPDPDDPLSYIRHATDAYWKMSPEQLDARYEKLDTEYKRLRDKSMTEPLDKDEQARMWLAIKGMRQILDENTSRSKLNDEKHADYIAKGYNPQPGKYMRQVDTTVRPKQKGFRQNALNKRKSRGYDDIVEVDDDELAHWSREFADHTGDATTGRDGFDGSTRQYTPGSVRDKVGAPTSKEKRKRNPEYEPTAEEVASATLSTDPSLVGKRKIDEVASRVGPQHKSIADADEPVETSKSWRTASGILAGDTDEMRSSIDASARARESIGDGAGTMSAPDQDSVDSLVENQMRDKVFPTLDGLDASIAEEDMTIVSAIELDEPLEVGSVIDHSSPIRGLLVNAESGEATKFAAPERSQRAIIAAPKGSRVMHTKNGHDGETDGVLLPSGSLEVTEVRRDGTLVLSPTKQKTKDEVLTEMIDSVESMDIESGSPAAGERRILRKALLDERAKTPPTARSTRGASADATVASRNSKRVDAVHKQMSDNDGSYFGTTPNRSQSVALRNAEDERFARVMQTDKRLARVIETIRQEESALARMGDLRSKYDSGDLPQEYFEFIDSVSPSTLDLLTSDNAVEKLNNTLFRFHERFDDRPRIALSADDYGDFLVNGKLRNPVESSPDGIGAMLQKSFEDNNGVPYLLPDSSRSHFGYLSHATLEQQIQEYLDELPGNGFVSREAKYFSGDGEMDQYSQHKLGGRTIEIVLAPETAKRTAYTRGDILDSKRQPTPLLSTDRGEVAAAHLSSQQNGATELEVLGELAEVAEATQDGSLRGLGSGRGGMRSMRSRTNPPTHGAVIGGGVVEGDVSQIRMPINQLELAPLTAEEIGGRDRIKQLLKDSSINGNLDEVIDKLLDGTLDDGHPAARFRRAFLLQRQHKTAKLAMEQHKRDHGDGVELVITNPYGVALHSATAISDIAGAPFGESDDELLYQRLRYDMNVANIKSLVLPGRNNTIYNDEELRAEYMRKGKLPLSRAEIEEQRRIQQIVGSDTSIADVTNAPIDPDVEAAIDRRLNEIGEDARSLSRVGKGGKTRIDTRKSILVADLTWDDDKQELTVTWKNTGEIETYSGVNPEHIILLENTYNDPKFLISDAVLIARDRATSIRPGGEHADASTLRTPEMDARRSVGLRSMRTSSEFDEIVLSDSELSELEEMGRRGNAMAQRVSEMVDAQSAKPLDGPLLGRSSTREVTGPGGGVRSTTPIAKRQRRVEEIFEEVRGKGLGALHDATDDELAELGLVRTGNTGIADGLPVYEAETPEAAAALLALGYNVELGEGARAVETKLATATLQKELNEYLKTRSDLTDEQRASFVIDACKMYVSGTNFFCGENIGTERMDMPQVSGRTLGDATTAARAAKAGLVKTKWEPGKRDANGNLTKLTPEEMAEFEALKARHPAKGKTIANPLSPEEKERFYELVDWNDTEVDFVDEWVEHMREAYGREDIIVELDGVSTNDYTASQSQIQAEKVAGMAGGIRENYDAFVAFAESQGAKRGTPEFFSLRDKWLAGELKNQVPILDKDGNQAIDDKTRKPKFANAWWAEGYIITSRDGYVVDGHHRWAAVRLINASLPPDEELRINTREVDTSIFEALNTAKAMQEAVGIKQAKLGKEDFFKPDASAPEMTPEELRQILSEHTDALPSKVQDLKERGIYSPRGAIESVEGRQESLAEGMRFYETTGSGITRDVRGEGAPEVGDITSRGRSMRSSRGESAKPEPKSVEVFKKVREMGEDGLHDKSDNELSQLGISRTEVNSMADGQPVYKVDDVATAGALMALGYNVDLGDKARAREVKKANKKLQKEINRYLEGLSDMTDKERAQYTIDSCKLYVAGTNVFCGKNIGTKRMKMPQVSGRLKGDDTNGARAAKAGLVPTDWKPGKRDADGKLTELTPEEMARFSELKAKHAKTNKKGEFSEGSLTDAEKAEFYSLVDWNDTEVNFVPRMIEQLNKRRKAKGIDGDAVVSRRNMSVDELTASQSQIQAEKVTGMIDGIEENYESFVRWAKSKGAKRGSAEFQKLREQWLNFEIKEEIPLVDADGNAIVGDNGKPKTAFPWWMDGSIISSKDGYVVDGHHRWAAIKAVNLTLPEDEQLTVHTEEIQEGIVASLTMAKAFQDHVGIKEAKLGEEDFYVPNADVAPMSADDFTAMLDDHDANADARIAEVAKAGTYTPTGAVEAASPQTVAEGFRFIERARGESPSGSGETQTTADRMAIASSTTARNRSARSARSFGDEYPSLARAGIDPRPSSDNDDSSLLRAESERLLGGATPKELKEINDLATAEYELLDAEIDAAEAEIVSELGSREAFDALMTFEPTPQEWTSLPAEKKDQINKRLEELEQKRRETDERISEMLNERARERRAKRTSGIAAARDIVQRRSESSGTMRSQRLGRRYTSEQVMDTASDVARGVAKQIDTEKLGRDLVNSWKKGGVSGVMSKLRTSIREGWSSWAIGYALDEGYITKQQARFLRSIAKRLGPKPAVRRKSADFETLTTFSSAAMETKMVTQ